MLDDIINEVAIERIRGSDAPIDTVMIIALVFVVLFGIFIFLQLSKGGGSALPLANKGKRLDWLNNVHILIS